MPIARHLRRIALLICVSAPLMASPVVPLAGVGLNRQTPNRGCAFVGKRLYCWGDNSFGQLGTGAASVTSLAEWVPRPDTRNGDFISPTSIGVGLGDHICVTDAGSVWCWGKNYAGQLGLGDRILREQPTRVPGLPGDIQEVATGNDHACARSAAYGVWCWGLNAYGQTGQQPTGAIVYDSNNFAVIGPAQLLPQQVPGLPGFVDSIALGANHSCALAGGRVYCWGRNGQGQLGDSGLSNRATPALVASVPADVRVISATSWNNCALAGDGDVWCWGQNAKGEVGQPPTFYVNPTPLRVSGLPGPATALEIRFGSSCASVAGQRWCWGESEAGRATDGVPREAPRPEGAADNWLGGCFAREGVLQCPDASTRYPWKQVDARPVPGFDGDVAQLALGRSFGCALTTDAEVWCWGGNIYVQQGNDPLARPSVAWRVPLPPARALAAGPDHACAATADGMWCWGKNRWGALGDGGTSNQGLPVRSQFDGTLIAAGEDHTCAWNAIDGLRCWGGNGLGQVNGNPSSEPILAGARPLGADKVVALALGRRHSCATIELDDGARESRCWGDLPLTPDDLLSQYSSDTAPRLMTAGAALPGDNRPLLRSFAQSACLGDLCYGRSYLPPDRGEMRVGVRVDLPDGLSGGFVLGGRLVCAQGVGSDLRCAALTSRTCSYESVLNPFMTVQDSYQCRASELGLAPIERDWVPVIGLPARPQHLAAGDDLACGTIGRQIWCWGPGSPLVQPFPLPPLASSYSPVYRAGAIEPAPRVALPRDSSRQCPAYAVASVSLLDPANPAAAGYWGLALELADGSRYLNGGLNFGGYGSGVGDGVPGYAAFSIQNPSGAPQIVNLDLSGDGGKFELTVLSTRPPSTEPTVMLREILILGEAQKRRSLTLPNGYHVVSLQPATGTSLFLVAAGTTQLDGSPAAFQGGVVVGGYLAGERSGFAAICTADASAITLRTQARSSGDAAGAGDLKLRVIEGQTGTLLYDSRD